MLTIPEELLLLHAALLDRMPARPRRDAHPLANEPLAAGRLIELVLARRLTVEFRRRHLLARDDVVVSDATPTGDALLDEVVERVAAADANTCSYWIKRGAKGSEAAYWDRLVARSLLRPDSESGDVDRSAADTDAVAAVIARIRAVLDEPERSGLRDVALVTLLAHTQSVFGLLHEVESTPSGLVRGYRAQRRDDRRAREALDKYKSFTAAAAGSGPGEQGWALAAADAIARIAQAAAGFRGSGPG